MNRSRSVSRRPALRHREEEEESRTSSPHRSSRSRSTSMASSRKASSMRDNYDDNDDEEDGRSRSVSRARSSGQHRSRLQHSSTLSKSAGVLAGIGIAALVAHKFWPKGGYFSSSSKDEQQQRQMREQYGGHGYSRDYHVPRDPQRGAELRGRRRPQSRNRAVDYQYSDAPVRHSPRNDEFGAYAREPSRRSMDRRSWNDNGSRGQALHYTYIGTSPEPSSVGYNRRHV